MARDILAFAEAYTVDTDDVDIVLGEYMRDHTSFRIGGSAEVYCLPHTAEALEIGLRHCRQLEIPWFVLGKGSNVLVSDRGYQGAVFDMTAMNGFTVEGSRVTAQAGVLLSQLAHAAAEAGLSGMEFAAGIPGTLGGAVFMNAGAYGGEMKDILREVTLLSPWGGLRTLPAEELKLSYRHSLLEDSGEILISAVMELEPGERETIDARMKELGEKRRAKQPLEYPSAGSTFKRPEGHFAGQLIEEAGLKGFTLGGAQVSEKHAGFVINRGGARAKDVLALCREVQRRVKENSGVELELEIRTLGDF